MGRSFRRQQAGQLGFDLASSPPAVLIIELNPYARRPIAFGTRRCHPDDFSRHGKTFLFFHETEQYEYLFAKLIRTGRRYEQTTIGDKGHIRSEQRVLVFDREG